jgi:O-antigen ligase
MTLQKFKENVIFGQGIGIFKTWNILHLGYWGNAHNDWLERLVELGLIGIILMVLVVINSIRKFNYKKDNIVGFSYFASFVSFLVLMGGSFPFEIAPLALLGLIGFWGTEVL